MKNQNDPCIKLVCKPDELEALIKDIEEYNRTENDSALFYLQQHCRNFLELYKEKNDSFHLHSLQSCIGCCTHVLFVLKTEYMKAYEKKQENALMEKSKSASQLFMKLAYSGLAHAADVGGSTKSEAGIRLIPLSPEDTQFGKGIAHVQDFEDIGDKDTVWSIADDDRLHHLAYELLNTLPSECHKKKDL